MITTLAGGAPKILQLACRFCPRPVVAGGSTVCLSCRNNNIVLIGRPKPRVLSRKEMLKMLAKLKSQQK